MGSRAVVVAVILLGPLACKSAEESAADRARSGCDREEAPACLELSRIRQRAGERDWATLLARACELEQSRCDGAEAELKKDAALFSTLGTVLGQRCGKGRLSACETLHESQGAKASGAAQWESDGCNAGSALLCAAQGRRELDGESPQYPVARRVLDTACKGDRAEACGLVANLYATGRGGARDFAAAGVAGMKACKANAKHCWNGAEFAELAAWEECSPLLRKGTVSDVVARPPVLEQSSTTIISYYKEPDRYETRLRERGIFVRETYLETTAIPGETYSRSNTEVDQYASATIKVKNQGCAPVTVDVTLTFDFDLGDRIARALGGAALGAGIAMLMERNKDEVAEMAAVGALAGAGTGLERKASGRVSPGESALLFFEVDTQSLFGSNRKMESVKVNSFTVGFPDGRECKPACLNDLRGLSGKHAEIKRGYERACEDAKHELVCDYLKAIREGNSFSDLTGPCHGGKAPNLEGACRRMNASEWL
ncbi:MAG: hypothetical protein MUF54_23240 [Polyangiaceae bacterium]|jgi:hypothetical protein|nr:hypothetical protein [Polyangiaceae bacterium]